MQAGAVRCAIREVGRRQLHRLQHRMAGHRPVAVQPLAHRHAGVQRLHHLAEAPDRDAAPGRGGGIAVVVAFGASAGAGAGAGAGLGVGRHGEEVPVLHRLAEGGVGDVVGGEREVVDAHAHLAVGQRGVGQAAQPGGGELVLADLELKGRHAAHARASRRARQAGSAPTPQNANLKPSVTRRARPLAIWRP